MAMETQIIRLDPENAAILARVADDVFDDDIDPARVAAYLASPGHMMVLAVAGDLVVGQVCAVIHRHLDLPTELYVDNLGVAEAYRRQGIASRLLDELTAWGRSQGCEESWVATEPDNEAARALYTRRGSKALPVVMFEYEL